MSEIGHSTLLKFFVDTSKMSEPSGKTDSSIESKVPGEQPLRGDYIQELQNVNVQENNVAVKDYSLSPVITVTKEESTFTKGDLKVQKVIVSEDISDETSNTNRKLTTTESTCPTEVQTAIHSEISSVTINTEGDTQTSTGDQKVVYKVTKIPKLKFKQAVDKIKNEEEMKKEGKDEVELGLKVTETVPGLKDEKSLLQQFSRSESIQQDSPKVDDEFDRIYDEIFENGPPSGNFPSPEKIEDTDKLETKFDEIIHAYDEQKAQANAEKVKSKIPLLKRKSEHDIYAPRQTLRKNSLNKRNSIDDTKCKLPVPLIKEKQNVELVSSQKQKAVSAHNVTVSEIVNTNISKSITTASHQKDGEINIMQETEINSTSEVSKSKIPTHLKEITAVEKASDIQTSEISPQFSIEKRNEDIFINIINNNETHEPETLISENTIKTLNVKDNISNIKTEPLIITDNVEKDPNTNDNNKKDITQNIIVEKDTGNRDQITETETPIDDSPQNEKPLDATNSNNLNKLEKVPNTNDNYKKDITQNIIVERDTSNRDQITETEAKMHIVTKVDDKNLKPINDSPQNEKPLDATNSNNVDKLEKVPNINDNNKKDIKQKIIVEKDTGNRDQITETETPIDDSLQNEKPLDATNSNNVDKLEKVLNINDNNRKDITQNIIVEKDLGNRDQIIETETKTHIVTKVDVKNLKPINDSLQNEKPLDATNSNNVDKLEKVPKTNDNNKKDITQNVIVDKDTGNRDQITETQAKTHIVTKADVKIFKPINDLPQNEKPLDATNFNNDFHEKNNHSENNFSKIEVQKINVNETNSNVSIKQEVRETVEIVSNSDIKDIQDDHHDKVRDNITNIPKDILHISRSDVCLKTNSVDNNSLQEIIYDDSKTRLSGENIKRNDVINMNRENATIITERISSKIQSNASEDLSRSNNDIKSNNLSHEYNINKYPQSEHISQKIITEVNNNEIKTEDIKINKAIEDIAIKNNKVNSSENSGKDINELEEEDVIILKGKVNRIISRLDSKEFKVNKCQLDDLPQEESVVSKIALFEQSKSIDTTQKASITKNKLEDEINVDKPKIVDEVLKIEKGSLPSDSKFSYNTFLNYKKTIKSTISVNENEIQATSQAKSMSKFDKIFKSNINLNKFSKTKENAVGNSEDEVFFKNEKANRNIINEYKINKEIDLDMRRAKSLAELNYDGVQGRVRQMVVRMNSIDKMALERREQNEVKRKTRHGSVSERIALFEKKVTPIRMESVSTTTPSSKQEELTPALTEEELTKRITELTQARATYGHYDNMTYVELSDGGRLPSLVVGTALLDPPLVKPIIKAAIDLGYRAIDTAYVYGNEQAIGEAIREKIQDGTVKREELFVLAKLWSTNHRHDLVSRACKQSLDVMGLDYFDLYLIHNPMSFKEGPNPLPKIANVLQYSEHDYLEAWFGIESLIKQGLVKRGGVSNFNSVQVERVLDKGKIKPVVNQVECHPYLSQARLQDYLSSRGVALSCFGCLGSSGTPRALRSSLPPVIHDPLVRTMAAGLGVTPAQLLLSYQVSLGRSVVVKASSAAHLWDDLHALDLRLAPAHAAGLAALNRNKRTFTFEGMGDTHKNYPFKIPF